MTAHRRHRFASFVVIVVSAIVLAACSSADSDAPAAEGSASTEAVTSTAAETSEPSAVSAAPTETTPEVTSPEVTSPAPTPTVEEQPVDTRPIDEPSRELATAMTLQAADFPEPWTVFEEAAPFAVTPDACFYRPDGAVTRLPNGATQNGPQMQIGTAPGWVSSSGIAFPDDASAQEFVGVLNTDARVECVRKYIDDGQAEQGAAETEVAITDRTTPELGEGGLEGYLALTLTHEDESVDIVLFLTFRIGRVVSVVTLEAAGMDEATGAQFNADHYDALENAYDRVHALGVE